MYSKASKANLLGILFCVGLIQIGYGQTEYINNPEEDGYIVLATRDTVKGYISFIREKELYTRVKFRKNQNEPYQNFGPEAIDYFFLENEGELFVSKRVLGEQHPTVDSVASSAFVRVMVQGPASLYSYTQNAKPKYLISNSEMLALLQKGNDRSKNVNGRLYNSEKPFQRTLRKLLSKCASVSPLLKYNTYDLRSIVTSYNDCSKVPSTKYTPRKSKTMFGFTLGYLNSNLEFNDQKAIVKPYGYTDSAPYGSYDLDFLLNKNFKNSTFTFGISLTNFTKDNKHLSFNTMINYTNRKWSSDYFSVDVDYLEIPLSINYNFGLNANIQPKLGIGVNLATPISKKMESSDIEWQFYRTKKIIGGGDTWPSMLPVNMPVIFSDQFKPGMITPMINLGIDVKGMTTMLSITFSQGLPASITKSELYKSSVSYQMVTLNYSFYSKARAKK